MADPSSLIVEDISVRFGGVVANSHVSLRAEPGKITALIGPNGAGKTTLINAITGFVRSEGQVRVGETVLSGKKPHVRRRLGLARTWQGSEVFDALTVFDNVKLAEEQATILDMLSDLMRPSRPADDQRVTEILEALGLLDEADKSPDDLSLGKRRLVGVARALAGRPSVVLLDEPGAGLGGNESAEFGRELQRLAQSDLSILLVDHDMSLIFGVADYVYVLDFGKIIAEGTPESVQHDPRVVEAYLGEAVR